jgi:hypothetical protein
VEQNSFYEEQIANRIFLQFPKNPKTLERYYYFFQEIKMLFFRGAKLFLRRTNSK